MSNPSASDYVYAAVIRRVWLWTVHGLASIPVAVLVCELATKKADARRDKAVTR